MNEQIKKMSTFLQIEYGTLWILFFLLSISFEVGWLPEGIYADNAKMQYILGTAGILATLLFVPLSLKVFSIILVKKIKNTSLVQAVKFYKFYSSLRLFILAVIIIMNLLIYYSTLQNLGGLCALIGITASLFCIPSLEKIKEDLDLINIQKNDYSS